MTEQHTTGEQAELSPRPDDRRRLRRVYAAGLVGTAIEFYDFGIFGYMAVFVAPVFFPSTDPIVSLLSTLAVFGVAFAARPVGGIVLGRWGDRVGRRKILLITVLTIGVATTLIGVLPGYATIGVAAPLLLVIARLAQGFSAGGESSGSLTYMAESAPANRRVFYGTATPVGSALGFATSALASSLVSTLLTQEQMQSWGWRIPFLIAFPLTLICLFLRTRIEDSIAFENLATNDRISKAPLRELFTQSPRRALRAVLLTVPMQVTAYLSLTFMAVYMNKFLGFEGSATYWITGAGIVLAIIIMPIAGWLADYRSRRSVGIIAYTLYTITAIPIFLLLQEKSTGVALLAIIISFVPYALIQVASYSTYGELFPARYRYTGVAFAMNIGSLAAGFAPYLLTMIIQDTSNLLVPAYAGVIVGVLAIITTYSNPETRSTDMSA